MAVPSWLVVGVEVQAVGGGQPPSPVLTVERITQTQAILSDGSRWRLKDQTQVGTPPYDPNRAYTGSVRRLRTQASIEARRIRGLFEDVENAARQRDEDGLRAAIHAIAGHLGLHVQATAEES